MVEVYERSYGSLTNEEEGGGVYIQPLRTFDSSLRDRMVKFGGTDLLKNVNVRNLGETDWNKSVGPMC